MPNLCVSVPENIYIQLRKMGLSQSKIFKIGFEFITTGGYEYISKLEKELTELKKQNIELKKELDENNKINEMIIIKILKYLLKEKHNDLYQLFEQNKGKEIELNGNELGELVKHYKNLFGINIFIYLQKAFNVNIKLNW